MSFIAAHKSKHRLGYFQDQDLASTSQLRVNASVLNMQLTKCERILCLVQFGGLFFFFPQNTMYVVSALMLKVKYCVVTNVWLFIMFNAAGSGGTGASFKSISFYIALESSSGHAAHL